MTHRLSWMCWQSESIHWFLGVHTHTHTAKRTRRTAKKNTRRRNMAESLCREIDDLHNKKRRQRWDSILDVSTLFEVERDEGRHCTTRRKRPWRVEVMFVRWTRTKLKMRCKHLISRRFSCANQKEDQIRSPLWRHAHIRIDVEETTPHRTALHT